MDRESIIQKIKHIVFTIVLPIYLWSISMKSLDEYLDRVEQEYETRRRNHED